MQTFRPWLFLVCCAALLALGACRALLPQGQSGAKSMWPSYEAASETWNKIVPYQTRKSDLTKLNIDPNVSPNISVLTYSDVIRRFVPSSAIAAENIDNGIRDCIAAKEQCSAYEVDIKATKRQRSGNFWLDSFNFKRQTEINGWRFNGLVVMKEDLVVYKLSGGQPKIQEAESTRNPLGPLQGIGEGALRDAVR
jgi:hypothetical protein